MRQRGEILPSELKHWMYVPFDTFEPAWKELMPDAYKNDEERCHLFKWLIIYEGCLYPYTEANQLDKDKMQSEKHRILYGRTYSQSHDPMWTWTDGIRLKFNI